MLSYLVRRATMPPSFMLVRLVSRLSTLKFQALEDTMPPSCGTYSKVTPFGVIYVYEGSSCDGTEINSAIVQRRSTTSPRPRPRPDFLPR
jgi:hypothetical protein